VGVKSDRNSVKESEGGLGREGGQKPVLEFKKRKADTATATLFLIMILKAGKAAQSGRSPPGGKKPCFGVPVEAF